jgi:orotidine-5'-phosphate decarboxylase
VGLVVGATRSLVASGLDEADLDGLLVLAPGFGAQGAQLSGLREIFGAASPRVIPSVSRSVVAGGPAAVRDRITEHLQELGL